MRRRPAVRLALHPDERYEHVVEDDDESDASSSCSDERAHVIANYLREIRNLRENIRKCDLYLKEGENGRKNVQKGSFSFEMWKQQNVKQRRKNRALAIRNCSSNETVQLQQRLRNLTSELGTIRSRLNKSDFNLTPTQLDDSYAKIIDLIQLQGPLTEDAVLRTLQSRFFNAHFFTNIGPILLSLNPFTNKTNPLTLSSLRSVSHSSELLRVVRDAVAQQSEMGHSQVIILSGSSGSGKTYNSMILLRQLFQVNIGRGETDAFKHLVAAFTVIRSLGNAKTNLNSESSRIGNFIEVQLTNATIFRTKIHCYFLDQSRVVRLSPKEKNYNIFYQILAGLTTEERTNLHLNGYSLQNLRYLKTGDVIQNEKEDANRFDTWKIALSELGIPFSDVTRVLAAVLVLGNVQFVQKNQDEVDLLGTEEIKSVASLLGISTASLFRGLTTRTHIIQGQIIKSKYEADKCNLMRDALAKALYCRTVATIIRRANSLKNINSGVYSSESNGTGDNGDECTKPLKPMAKLNSVVKNATDGFIGILDMFGFEDGKPSQLEQLCINLCAETLQHFYNTYVFKTNIETCKEEGIHCDVDIDYTDNVPCIDLISSLRFGLLSLLDIECSMKGTPETYIEKIKKQHRNAARFDAKLNNPLYFGIQHFAGKVIYNARNFIDTNRDAIPDDIITVFHNLKCNFGFATHLFSSELKNKQESAPTGILLRISPTQTTKCQSGNESTLIHDFHGRLDNLLRTLVQTKPHFIRCIKANNYEESEHFDRGVVMHQIRSLQVLETVNLMASGFSCKMRFKVFNTRYRCLVATNVSNLSEENVLENCKVILNYINQYLETMPKKLIFTSCAIGKKHIFMSEGARQQLEMVRANKRDTSAVLIQSVWRGCRTRKYWTIIKRNMTLSELKIDWKPAQLSTKNSTFDIEKSDVNNVQHMCFASNLDWIRQRVQVPPIPPSRPYTVIGSTKIGYPQRRIMLMSFKDSSSAGICLAKGQIVTVIGASSKRGHLLVNYKKHTYHVPYQFMELKHGNSNAGMNV